MFINQTNKINPRSNASFLKALIIIIAALIVAFLLINEVGLRRISKINLNKIKSKIKEEIPQKMENEEENKSNKILRIKEDLAETWRVEQVIF